MSGLSDAQPASRGKGGGELIRSEERTYELLLISGWMDKMCVFFFFCNPATGEISEEAEAGDGTF